MVSLPKLPESTRFHILSHHFLTGHEWKSSESAFPLVFKQEEMAKIDIIPQYKKRSVCAELQVNIMCKEISFLCIIVAFIRGVLTVKQRPSQTPIASSRFIFT